MTKRFIILILVSAIVNIGIFAVRLKNPELTETQLFLTYWKELLVVYLLVSPLVLWWWREDR